MSHNFAFHFDATGRPRAASAGKDALPPALVQFLESDLAMDTAYCDRLLAAEKQAFDDDPWRCAGNAFAVAMTKTETTLTPLVETKSVGIAGLIVVLTCVPLFAAILRIPFSIIAPVILVICAIGAYTVHNSMFDVWMMVVFGVAGYVFKKLNYPLAPLVLAIVLGDRAEASFRQAMLMSQGDMSIFFSNMLVGTLTGLALLLLFWPLLSAALAALRNRLRGS